MQITAKLSIREPTPDAVDDDDATRPESGPLYLPPSRRGPRKR